MADGHGRRLEDGTVVRKSVVAPGLESKVYYSRWTAFPSALAKLPTTDDRVAYVNDENMSLLT